jgi:hypothetical protein
MNIYSLCVVLVWTVLKLTNTHVAEINKLTVWLYQKNEDKFRGSVKASTPVKFKKFVV